MVFSSIIFLLFFMPLTVIISYLLPKGLKNPFLFIVSLIFYAWGEPVYCLLMLLSILVHFISGKLMDRYDGEDKKRFFIAFIAVLISLVTFIIFKYLGGFLGLSLPIGISFYTFQIISYTIDVYKRNVKAEKSFVGLGTYISLFPQLIAGPIVRYSDIRTELNERVITGNDLFLGLQRFSVGLFKKVVFANSIGQLWQEIHGEIIDASLLTALIGAIAFTLQIYFDFSGYSDMAVGLGRMLGFKFPENFRYPYVSKSITEFWRRWHITLSSWFRDYLYIPLGGSKKGIKRQVINLFIVWSLTGIWHGAGFNFLVWGMYYFLFLVLEKFVLRDILDRIPRFLSHVYTMLIVIVGWMIFESQSAGDFKNIMESLLGKNGIWDSMGIYYLRTNWFIMLIMGLTALGVFKGVMPREEQDNTITDKSLVLSCFIMVMMLFISIAFLTGDGYNPFLYFRF